MSLISKLSHHFPNNWQYVPRENYEEEKYLLFDVNEYSEEYSNVISSLSSLKMIHFLVRRIQYPAAYLRYKLKSELDPQSQHYSYVIIDKSASQRAIRFNGDIRRTEVNEISDLSSVVSKLKMLHTTNQSRFENTVVVVYRCRQYSNYDDDRYPMYTITGV